MKYVRIRECWGCKVKINSRHFPFCSDKCWADSGAPSVGCVLREKLFCSLRKLELE